MIATNNDISVEKSAANMCGLFIGRKLELNLEILMSGWDSWKNRGHPSRTTKLV